MESAKDSAEHLFVRALGSRSHQPQVPLLDLQTVRERRELDAMLVSLRKGKPIERQSVPSGLMVGITYWAPPSVPHLPGVPQLPPTAASVWGMLQSPKRGDAQVGVNASLSALGDRFNGFSTDAFVDLRSFGIDCSMDADPLATASGKVEFSVALPAVHIGLHSVKLSHRVAVPRLVSGRMQHVTTLSTPVAQGACVARLQFKQRCTGTKGSVSMELGRKQSSTKGSGMAPQVGSSGTAAHAGSDSDGENMCSSGPRLAARLPHLRLHVSPSASDACRPADVALQWGQAWSKALNTGAAFYPGQLSLNLCSRPAAGLRAAAALAMDVSGLPAMRGASARLVYRLRGAPGARQTIQLESSFSSMAGMSHVLKFRRRGGKDGEDSQADVALKLRAAGRLASLEFEAEVPL